MGNKNYYRNNKASDSGYKRSSKPSWGGVVAIVVAAGLFFTAAISGFAYMSDGFTNMDPTTWFERELNPDNLIKKENYSKQFPDKLPDEKKGDLEFKIKDDGTIVLKGQYKDADASDNHNQIWALTSVTLSAGEYTLSMGNTENNEEGLFGLVAEIGGKAPEYVGATDLKFEVTEETTVTISVYVNNDNRFFGIHSYIRPILVGKDAKVQYFK